MILTIPESKGSGMVKLMEDGMDYEFLVRAIHEMKELQLSDDPEHAHSEADKILCRVLRQFGCDDLIDEWKKITKWYA